MSKKIYISFLLLSLVFCKIAEAKTFSYTNAQEFINKTQSLLKTSSDTMEKLNLQLELAVVNFIERHEKHSNASKNKPAIKAHQNGQNLYYYSEIDTSHIEIEVTPSKNEQADYFGKVRYIEVFYESLCSSSVPQNCQFNKINSRRVTEFAIYKNGKWQY